MPVTTFKSPRSGSVLSIADPFRIGHTPQSTPTTLVAETKFVAKTNGVYGFALTQKSSGLRDRWLECRVGMSGAPADDALLDIIPEGHGKTAFQFAWSRVGTYEVSGATPDRPVVLTLRTIWSCDGSEKGGMRKTKTQSDVTVDDIMLVPLIQVPGDFEFRAPNASRGEFVIRNENPKPVASPPTTPAMPSAKMKL